ncbi:MAG: aldehyde dehydrogenase family protein [Desulfuromonadaceae bacterium]|nr:aldehyde dehydrogenase family protein [Desulfuromonadaceae bacterium]
MAEGIAKDPVDGMAEREYLVKAQQAAKEFATYSPEQVNKIVAAVTAAAVEKAQFYAEWAVRETGFGVMEHKIMKNQFSSAGITEFYKDQSFAGYEIDHKLKLVKFARPAGVVLGLAPCTNPIVTINFKSLICMMTRNALVLCPHPAAIECSIHCLEYLAAVAVQAGAPKNVLQIVRSPSLPVVSVLTKSEKVNVILATGGAAMVRAAYSSGNPAIGVGAANVAHYVDDTTKCIDTAAGEVVFSASFDNCLLCASESVLLAHSKIADELFASMSRQGAYFISNPSDIEKLRKFLYVDGAMNPKAIGKSAVFIASEAGIKIPEGVVLLCVEIDRIDKNDVCSCEKMYPVLGVKRVDGLADALKAAQEMLEIGGKGHSAAIHSENSDAIVAWSSLDVYRIAVNGPAVLVSAGLASGLNPSATIGTGYFGRSSVGGNVGPEHLIHWTCIAYSENPAVEMGDVEAAVKRWNEQRGSC